MKTVNHASRATIADSTSYRVKMSKPQSTAVREAALRICLLVIMLGVALPFALGASPAPTNLSCKVESVDYKGWKAQQLSNGWVQLVIVPQNGGRLMQVTFAGHAYLFVNPKLAGKYFPPSGSDWFNYGGDKL